LFLEIAMHYGRQMPAGEQGLHFLALALFAHFTPQTQPFAPRLAGMAVRADADIKATLKRLVPDLEPADE